MNTQIYEEASDWLVRNRQGDLDPQEKRRFDAWMRESPQHVTAYLEMSAVWEDVGSLDPAANAGAEELIARARTDVNVYPLGAGHPGERHQSVRHPSVRRRWYAIAASVLLVIAATSTWFYSQRNVYSTDIGEQRSIVLPDGSTIELNSRSRVQVRYTNTQRSIGLIEGQALFRVAHNPARPFIVDSNGTQVRAVGTQFDVYRKQSGTIVTVVEGRVTVSSQPDNSTRSPLRATPSLYLSAGEQVTVPAVTRTRAPELKPQYSPRATAAATAWTQHALIFDSSPLTEVAEEFNRYNTRQLVIEDPGLAEVQISGVFSSVNPGLLLRFLRTQPELIVEEAETEIRISKR